MENIFWRKKKNYFFAENFVKTFQAKRLNGIL